MHSLKPLIATLLLIASAFFCLFTNPTMPDYLSWAKVHYTTQQTSCPKGLTEVFLQVVGPTIIENATTSKNYVLFTFFETNFNGSCMQTIGILDHFIPLPTVAATVSNSSN